jgi:16S rRNA (cytosine967-C5)-methyltransferase
MAISTARIAAYEILLRVEREESFAPELLHAAKYAALSAVDHGLATELVMGVLRWRPLLDSQIEAASSLKLSQLDLEVLTALRLGCYQLAFLDRVPTHAAVNESVDLVKRARKRSAAGFANAVLRRLAGKKMQRPDPDAATDSAELAAAWAHPAWLVERWAQAYGLERTRRICVYDQRTPAAALRIFDREGERELVNNGIALEPGSLLASARRVNGGDITKTRAFRDGRVAIQDEGSQLVGLLVGRGSRLLDCCAAPGGKTRILAQENPSALVIAAEIYPRRAWLMRGLVREQNVRITAGDARNPAFAEVFDRVLVDAPCSGTGTLARNPEIKWRLSGAEDLARFQDLQIQILEAAMRQVAPGGRIVYSTCSLEREENEQVIEKAMTNNSGFRMVNCRDELQRLAVEKTLIWPEIDSLVSGPFLRTIPGVHPCDGFFAAIMERGQRLWSRSRMPHAPGPRGSPQLPQGPAEGAEAALELPFADTAKTESCGASFLLWHFGHAALSRPKISASNW